MGKLISKPAYSEEQEESLPELTIEEIRKKREESYLKAPPVMPEQEKTNQEQLEENIRRLQRNVTSNALKIYQEKEEEKKTQTGNAVGIEFCHVMNIVGASKEKVRIHPVQAKYGSQAYRLHIFLEDILQFTIYSESVERNPELQLLENTKDDIFTEENLRDVIQDIIKCKYPQNEEKIRFLSQVDHRLQEANHFKNFCGPKNWTCRDPDSSISGIESHQAHNPNADHCQNKDGRLESTDAGNNEKGTQGKYESGQQNSHQTGPKPLNGAYTFLVATNSKEEIKTDSSNKKDKIQDKKNENSAKKYEDQDKCKCGKPSRVIKDENGISRLKSVCICKEKKAEEKCKCGKPLSSVKEQGIHQFKRVCICGKGESKIVKFFKNIVGFST